jgi:polyphosphate kinase
VALVVRREGTGLRRYLHLGTGNYNPKTARLYTDLGLLTCRPELGADATDLFNYLTGLSRQGGFRRLLVAPTTLRPRIRDLIVRETDHARAGRPARIVAKVTALVDPEIIELLYEASKAGVEVDCIVRGACSLHPGLPGISERIRVRSIIGEFLEHSRILGFANGGRQEWYTGSADLMERNLDRRVEVVFPVEDLGAMARIEEIVAVMLDDDRRSWQLGADAAWRRTEEILAAPGSRDTFAILKERALASAAEQIEPAGGIGPSGSLDPRA